MRERRRRRGRPRAPGRSSVPELTGQVALVTGASTGIGRHLVDGLAARGDGRGRVWPAARSGWPTAMAEVAATTGVRGLSPWPRTSPTGPRWTPPSRGWPRELGRVDLLVNNAGVIDADEVPVWEADPDQWTDVVGSHIRGAQLLVRAVVPGMLARGHGRIVNLASGNERQGQPGLLGVLRGQDGALCG